MFDNAKEYDKTAYVVDDHLFVVDDFHNPELAAQRLAHAWKEYTAPEGDRHYCDDKPGGFAVGFADANPDLTIKKRGFFIDRDMARCFLKKEQGAVYHVLSVDPRTGEKLPEPYIEVGEKNEGDTVVTVIGVLTLREFIETQIDEYSHERPALYAVRAILPGEIELYHSDHLEEIRAILEGSAYDRAIPQIDRAIDQHSFRQSNTASNML
jgi:hypothetical protein